MKTVVRRGVLPALAAFAMLASVAVAEKPSRLKLAQDLARAHEAWPPGRGWVAANRAKAGQLIIPVLNRCLPDSDDGELTAFSVYLRLSRKGSVLEVVADVEDAALGRCMTRESREVQLPEPPREDFWLQVNLAALL